LTTSVRFFVASLIFSYFAGCRALECVPNAVLASQIVCNLSEGVVAAVSLAGFVQSAARLLRHALQSLFARWLAADGTAARIGR
jgi:hypothetical protein